MVPGPIDIRGTLGVLKPEHEIRFDTSDGTMSVDGGPYRAAGRLNDMGSTGFPTIMIYDFSEIVVGAHVTIHAKGAYTLGLVATGDILILQDLDASGGTGTDGTDGHGCVGAGGGGGGGGGGGVFIVSAHGYVHIDGMLAVRGGPDGNRGRTYPDLADGGGFGGLGGAGGPGGGAGGMGGASTAGGAGAGGGSGSSGGGGGAGGNGGQRLGTRGAGGFGAGVFGSNGPNGLTGYPLIAPPTVLKGAAGGDGNGFTVKDPDGGKGGDGGAAGKAPTAGGKGGNGVAANGGAGGGGGGGGGGDRFPAVAGLGGAAGGGGGAGGGGSASGGGTGGTGSSGGGGAFLIASPKAVVIRGDVAVSSGVGAVYGTLFLGGDADVDLVAESGSPLDVTSVNQIHVFPYPSYLGLRPEDLFVNGGGGAGGMGGDGQSVALLDEHTLLLDAKAEIIRSIPPHIESEIDDRTRRG